MAKKMVTIDGNTAAAHVAYAFSDVAAIYPITPSSPMGENSEIWASQGLKNLEGQTVEVIEMQSEAGAAGSVHGSLVAGAQTTTFTASQGLLLMIPNMYKIAGEMLPTVFHVSARSLAAQALSIFGDHSDVMSVRQTGFAMVAANSIQETMDLALVSHLATLEGQIPFLNFFDGFRTSHEIQKVEEISYEDMKSLVKPEFVERFRKRAMRPEEPICRVAAQNPDVYFQGRETTNNHYNALPAIVQKYMDQVGELTGREYKLFDYVGAADAETIVVAMGSGCDTIEPTINYLNAQGAKYGMIKVRLFRPFSVDTFVDAIPSTCKTIVALDRTKEPGSIGEPLFQDIVTALTQKGSDIKVIGGRYGLSSKEFTPGMVKAIFDHANGAAFHGFTVGINDDVSNLSISYSEDFNIMPADVKSCMFWGLGADGTVGAAKNSVKIIGGNTDKNAQAYFVYDSKKSGGVTVSHLRFGDSSCNYPFLINHADFVSCSNPAYVGRYDMLSALKPGGTFLLNSEIPTSEVFSHLTKEEQQQIIDKKINFYNIDALKISTENGLGHRTNTVMQTVFFKLSGILPEEQAIEELKKAIKKTFAKKGDDIVQMNWKCVDAARDAVEQVEVPATVADAYVPAELIGSDAADFAKDVILPVMLQKGDGVPVSKMTFDGTIPTGTTKVEKRGVAPRVPKWIAENCIQCNQCVQSCPHAVVRAKQIEPASLESAPESFNVLQSKTKNEKDLKYKLQVYIEDCTGCGVCIETCPAKTKALEFSTLEAEREAGERTNAEFFEALPNNILDGAPETTVKGAQFKTPLFEFSGACAGCGETPYVKLVTQLFGNRMVIANATGCSSIYGGTFPTIPYCKDDRGHGPAFGNSLFEDNAEYGFGMRLAVDSNRGILKAAAEKLVGSCTLDSCELCDAIKAQLEMWDAKDDAAIEGQCKIAELLPAAMENAPAELKPTLQTISDLKDYFVDKSVWIFGGDGWAYDIGYGGVDHVVSQTKNVNILVMDTEVYSNTGGQASKATPIGAVAKFANGGMQLGKKLMPFMCMSYGHVYVAHVNMGANRNQLQKAMMEAEAWDGPSIIFAYAPCIAHGINMMKSQKEAKTATECGYWPLFRYNPALEEGKRFVFESKEPKGDYQAFIRGERRYTALQKTNPDHYEQLLAASEADAKRRWTFYQNLGNIL